MKKIKKWIGYSINLTLLFGLICVMSMYLLENLGIQSYIVRSGSMEPAIMTGSLCFVDTRFDYYEIEENDIIAFQKGDIPVTHRVIRITEEGFITKGDNNKERDGLTTTKNNYIGKNVLSIPWLGYVLSGIQTRRWKIIVITLIVSIALIQRIRSV